MTTEKNEQLKQLDAIERLVRFRRTGRSLPGGGIEMILIGGVAGVLVGAAAGSLMTDGFIKFFTLTACMALGARIGFRYKTISSWDERIYVALSEYKPVNQSPYRDMQEVASEEELTDAYIVDWLEQERQAVSPKPESATDLARKRFATK